MQEGNSARRGIDKEEKNRNRYRGEVRKTKRKRGTSET